MGNKRSQSDANKAAFALVAGVTGLEPPTGVYEALLKRQAAERAAKEAAKNPAAVELGRRGGLKGGKARAESLSAAERKAIASKAATKRWETRNALKLGFSQKEAEILAQVRSSGMTTSEIAKALGLPASSIHDLRKRAEALLKEKLHTEKREAHAV